MLIVGFISINILLDFLFILIRKSDFYFSESLLFSTSFWIIFLLTFYILKIGLYKTEKNHLKILLLFSVFIFHILLYPSLVWLISIVFFQNPFPYWQTFSFSIASYFIIAFIIYTYLFYFLQQKIVHPHHKQNNQIIPVATTILVSENPYQKTKINVEDIIYLTAASPYVNIYLHSKKYLITNTLKSLEEQLNRNQFVRIHKSHIVNVSKVKSIISRQNGDYDITLLNDIVLRVSRNYASNFKIIFSSFKHLATK